MWPKILLDLLPHFARLMPAADKYLNPRSASEKAQEAALAALADDVRGPLGQMTEAYAGIGRQLQEQSALVAELSVEVTRARIAAESAEARFATLEKTAGMMVRLLWTVLMLVAAVAVLGVVVLVKLRTH